MTSIINITQANQATQARHIKATTYVRHSRVGGNPVSAFAMAAQFTLDTRLRGYDGMFDISPPVMTTATHNAMSAQDLTDITARGEDSHHQINLSPPSFPRRRESSSSVCHGSAAQSGKLLRVGHDNGGHWKVLDTK